MSKKAIEVITSAEQRADEIRADAQAKAREMIARAEREGRELCEKCEKEMNASYKKQVSEVREKSEEIIRVKKAEAIEDAEKMTADAEFYMADAKKLIIRRIREQCQ